MMPILDDHSTLIFLHIPKTGGMSVTKILESCFDPDTYPPHIANFQALKQVNDLFSKRLITGHYAYQDIISLDFPHDVYYMTWLRDPVERVVSHFYYLKTHEDHAHHSQVTAYNTIDEFLRDDAMRLFYDNLQTRFLAAPFDYYTQPDFSDDDQRHMLERATANLSSMACVGLTEEFNLSLELMAYTFGWSSVAQPVHVNVTRNRPRVDELSSEARYRILDANQMDIALYHTARRLFWQRVATMEHPLPAPQTELDALFEAHTRAIHQKINRLKNKLRDD